DSPEAREIEPNDAVPNNDPAGEGMAGENGSHVVFHGRIQSPGDRDRWTFQAKKGAALVLDLQAAALGSPLDAALAVFDASGKELARSDDRADGQPDPRLTFQAPEDGAFVAEVRSRFASLGDATHAYRLKLGAPDPPPFRLTVATDALLVPRGGEFKLPVKIERAPGYDEPIELTLSGLPAGLAAAPVIAEKGSRDSAIVVSAVADAKIQATRATLQGVMRHVAKNSAGEPSEVVLTRAAEYLPAKAAGPASLDLWAVAVVPTPFKLVGEYLFNYAPRGGASKKPFRVERNGFAGPIEVRLADRQTRHLQGVTGPTLMLASEISEFVYPVTLPPWMELGRTSRTCIALFGTVEDADGAKHVVSYTSFGQNDQIITIVDPEVVKLRLEPASIALQPGESEEVVVAVERPADAGAVTIELASPSSGVSAGAVVIGPGEPSGKLTLSLARDAKQEATVLIRATTSQNGDPLTGEATLDVVPLVAETQ
ncbi:MAG TPA: PPC domain-containing protein, partial [Pirellulales bacterium]